jgi:hypothetical protein
MYVLLNKYVITYIILNFVLFDMLCAINVALRVSKIID